MDLAKVLACVLKGRIKSLGIESAIEKLGKKEQAEVKVFKQKDPLSGQTKEVVQEQIKLPLKDPKGAS